MYSLGAMHWRCLHSCALLGALVISLLLYKATTRPQVFLITSSPENTYTVHLVGRKDRPHMPIISHNVHLDVIKNSETFLWEKHLHSGDWLDPSFEILYPQHTWVSDNILRLYRYDNFSNRQPDILKVINNTNEVVKYIRVISDCMVLFFDTRPRAMIELHIPTSRGNLKWVSADGEYSERRSIRRDGVDFVVPDKLSGPFTYYIHVSEDGLRIESTQLEKYRGQG